MAAHNFVCFCTNGHCTHLAIPEEVDDGGSASTEGSPIASGGAISIAGSVGFLGKNYKGDVKKIQAALNDVGPANGGPSPELKVDDMPGPKTQAAIRNFQTFHGFVADSRVDPGQRTLAKLNELLTQQSSPTVRTGLNGSALGVGVSAAAEYLGIYASIARANQWVVAARQCVDRAQDYLLYGAGLTNAAEQAYSLVDLYFRLSKLSVGQQQLCLNQLRTVFNDMHTAIAHDGPTVTPGTGIFQIDPTNGQVKGAAAYSFHGGWRIQGQKEEPQTWNSGKKRVRRDAIYIVSGALAKHPLLSFVHIIVHELAHFVGPSASSESRIGDHAYSDNSAFTYLGNYHAMRNAESYAVFAGHTFEKSPHWFHGKPPAGWPSK